MVLNRTFLSIALVVALVVVPVRGGSIDAENRHGDPGNAGRANFIGTNPMTMHWSVPIKPTARGRLSASNNKQAIVISDHQSVMCVDTETGDNIWDSHLTTPRYIADSPTITDNLGIVTCNGGYVIAYDLKRGCEFFRLGTGWVLMSSPKCSENYILAIGANEELTSAEIMAVNPDTGRISWRKWCQPKLHSPTLGPGYVVIPSQSNGQFHVLNESDGSVLWQSTVDGEINHTSTRFGLVAVETKNSLTIFDYKTGDKRWSWISGDETPITWPATISDDTIFVCTDEGKKLYAIDVETGETSWQKKLESSTKQPIVGRDYLILTLERAVSIRSESDGNEIWGIDTVGSTVGNALAVSDNMMIATSLSKIISLKTAGYEISSDIDRLDLGEVTTDNPYLFNTDITLTNHSISETHLIVTSNADWLSVGPESSGFVGGGQMDVSASADLEGKPDGVYESIITVAWEYGELSIPVTATKVTAIPKSPRPGFITVDSSKLNLTSALNVFTKPTPITLTNTGEMTVGYSVETNVPWLFFSRNNGTLKPGQKQTVGITCITQNASMGMNHGVVKVSSESGQLSTISVDLERVPGHDLIIMKVTDGKDWIDVNGIRIRCRPSPEIVNGSLYLPLRVIAVALDARLERWEGNEDAPCKTEFNQLKRNGITVGNCVGSDIISIDEVSESSTTIEIPLPSKYVDNHVMLPVQPVLEAFDDEMETRNDEDSIFFELRFPEIVKKP